MRLEGLTRDRKQHQGQPQIKERVQDLSSKSWYSGQRKRAKLLRWDGKNMGWAVMYLICLETKEMPHKLVFYFWLPTLALQDVAGERTSTGAHDW